MSKLLTRICNVAAAITLVCITIAIALSIANQSLRQQVAERQQIINQGLAFGQINTRLANSLAAIATRDNDEKIKKLLADHGITMRTDQPTQPSPASK